MAFRVEQRAVVSGDRSGNAIILGDDVGTVQAEIWPMWGFNCLRWQIREANQDWQNLMYVAPDWETNPVPTRSGHPVLFPFPNRMKHGKFEFEGKSYQLPLNETSGLHAIHGYTPRLPWRTIETGTDGQSAFATGEFQLSLDAPHAVWPADARIRLTYRLSKQNLSVVAVIDAADGKAMPFGVGYHPYFIPPEAPQSIETWQLQASTEALWESDGNFPTGKTTEPDTDRDFRKRRAIGSTKLDTLYSATQTESFAILAAEGAKTRLRVAVQDSFSKLLLFTPVHRQAVAIEPYTCTTDAMNLQSDAVRCGWQVLDAGAKCTLSVNYCLELNS